MSNNGAKPFDNNWAYLKTELRWLDRVLMMAVSRKRQDDKTIHRVANTAADKATSHWWKGIVAINRGIDDREGPPPKPAARAAMPSLSYSQQLEMRIQASQSTGVVLALPLLRDRLKLSEVEKNIVLMAIAPEINRRYGRLYDYLQEEEGALADSPTVDLCLRLLCRNDNDWQQARARLTATHSLVNRGLLEWIGDEEGTLLSQQVRIRDDLASFLLADNPQVATFEAMLVETSDTDEAFISTEELVSEESVTVSPSAPAVPSTTTAPAALPPPSTTVAWDQLVLPKKLIRQLQYLARQAEPRQAQGDLSGLVVLLVGDAGTGKTLAGAAIAAHINTDLTCVDLETLQPELYPRVLTDSPQENSSLLLIQQGEEWFGRQPQVAPNWLHQWWLWRQQFGLTLVTAESAEAIRPRWRQKFDSILTFPRPTVKARQQLWEQAFASEFNTRKIDWAAVAEQLPLTGGEIQAIAQSVQLDLRSRQRRTVTLTALRAALELHQPDLTLRTTRTSS